MIRYLLDVTNLKKSPHQGSTDKGSILFYHYFFIFLELQKAI